MAVLLKDSLVVRNEEMSAVIVGSGTYGEVYLHYLRQAGHNIIGFLDDNSEMHNRYISKIPVFGGTDLLIHNSRLGFNQVFCPIGNNAVRMQINQMARSL